ncbi:MAG: hypothetical protein JNM80_03425 [Phycisphaerae bacterium]|nr:hypothetical protein [Phycisphaerae bacterium]
MRIMRERIVIGANVRLASMGVIALALGGCISPTNDRMTEGRTLRQEAFLPPPAPSDQPRNVEPSVSGLDRGNWPRTTILVPVDGTDHTPIYAKRGLVADKTARQRRHYPTAESALEMAGGSEGQQQTEALWNHWLALTDTLLIGPRMLLDRPWQWRSSPDEAYERLWRVRPAGAPPEPEALEPFQQPRPSRVTP